jgi:hypothetical protein
MGDEFSYRSPHAVAIASMYDEEPEKVAVSSPSSESSNTSDPIGSNTSDSVMISSATVSSITVGPVVSEKFTSKYVPGSTSSLSSTEFKSHVTNSIFSYKPTSPPPLPVVVSISSDHFTSSITPLRTLGSSSLSPSSVPNSTLIPSSTITSTSYHQLNSPSLGHPFGAYSEREINILHNNHSLNLIRDEGVDYFFVFQEC